VVRGEGVASVIAVLVIDMQNAFFEDPALAARRDELVRQCNELVRAAVRSGHPVLFVGTEHERDRSTWSLNMLDDDQGFLFRGTHQARPVPGLDVGSLPSIVKTRDSAFLGTDLAQRLRNLEVDTVVLAGVSTHSCVAQTAADAFAHNFRVVYAADATGTEDPAAADAVLAVLCREYRQRICTVGQIVAALQGEVEEAELLAEGG
jgi:nicotinamidase-related amidase